MEKGHCQHGEFELTKGCPQCIAESRGLINKAMEESGLVAFEFSPEAEAEMTPDEREDTAATENPPARDAREMFKEADAEINSSGNIVKRIKEAEEAVAGKEVISEPPVNFGQSISPLLEIIPIPPALVVIETQVGRSFSGLFQLYQEAAGLLQVAKKRTITKNEDLKPATDDLAIIATCKKAMFSRKAEIVEPFKTRLDAINQAFADLMFPVLEADRLTRNQVNDFDNEQRRKAAEAQRIEAAKYKLAQEEAVLSGTGEHTQELGTAQAPPPVPEHTRTDLGTLGGRDNWKARVVDFALLDDQWKLPNEQLLNSHARSTKGERPIPGVEFWNDRGVTMRTR